MINGEKIVESRNDRKYKENKKMQDIECGKAQEKEADEKVVFEGNAFYEIDLKCVRERKKG